MLQVVLESVRSMEKCVRLRLKPVDPKDYEILVSFVMCIGTAIFIADSTIKFSHTQKKKWFVNLFVC